MKIISKNTGVNISIANYGNNSYPNNIIYCCYCGLVGSLLFFWIGTILEKLPNNFICNFYLWIGKNSLYTVVTTQFFPRIAKDYLEKIFPFDKDNQIKRYHRFPLAFFLLCSFIIARNILCRLVNKSMIIVNKIDDSINCLRKKTNNFIEYIILKTLEKIWKFSYKGIKIAINKKEKKKFHFNESKIIFNNV